MKAPSSTPQPEGLLIEIDRLRRARRYRDILRLVDSVPPNLLRSTPSLMLAKAGSLSHLRRHSEALAVLIDAEVGVRTANDRWSLSTWQLLLAIQLIHSGRVLAARSLLQEAIAEAVVHAYPRILADAYNSLGVCHSFLGQVDHAVLMFKRALTAWQGLGEPRGVAFANHNIGLVFREWGDPWRAEPYLQVADSYYMVDGIVEERISILAERALLYCDLGDDRLSKKLATRALAGSESLSAAVRASALRAMGTVTCRFESAAIGEGILHEALDVLGNEHAGLLRGEILEELAVLVAKRDPNSAKDLLDDALNSYKEVGSQRHCERLRSRFHV